MLNWTKLRAHLFFFKEVKTHFLILFIHTRESVFFGIKGGWECYELYLQTVFWALKGLPTESQFLRHTRSEAMTERRVRRGLIFDCKWKKIWIICGEACSKLGSSDEEADSLRGKRRACVRRTGLGNTPERLLTRSSASISFKMMGFLLWVLLKIFLRIEQTLVSACQVGQCSLCFFGGLFRFFDSARPAAFECLKRCLLWSESDVTLSNLLFPGINPNG